MGESKDSSVPISSVELLGGSAVIGTAEVGGNLFKNDEKIIAYANFLNPTFLSYSQTLTSLSTIFNIPWHMAKLNRNDLTGDTPGTKKDIFQPFGQKGREEIFPRREEWAAAWAAHSFRVNLPAAPV